jgi:hypothetical protein
MRLPDGLDDADYIGSFPGASVVRRKVGRKTAPAPADYTFHFWGNLAVGEPPNLPSVWVDGSCIVLSRVVIQHRGTDAYLEGAYQGTNSDEWTVTFRRWRHDLPKGDETAVWAARRLLELEWAHPRGTFESRDAFMAVFGPVVQALRREQTNPTTGAVLKRLRARIGTVDRSQLTRWHQAWGWNTWADFLNDVE